MVAAGALDATVVAALGNPATTVEATAAAWIGEHGAPTDLVVVPGGRNGAIGTARTTKLATSTGCSILVAADRASVTATDRAAEALGLVTRTT